MHIPNSLSRECGTLGKGLGMWDGEAAPWEEIRSKQAEVLCTDGEFLCCNLNYELGNETVTSPTDFQSGPLSCLLCNTLGIHLIAACVGSGLR